MSEYTNPYGKMSIEEVLAKCACVITGDHFVYKMGDHGPDYVNKDASFLHPMAMDQIGFLIAHKAVNCFDCSDLHIVIGPVVGGALLAQTTAYYLSTILNREILAGFADKDGEGFVVKRGYDKEVSGHKVLAVEDIINTGGSIREVIEAIKKVNGTICGVVGIVNRGGVVTSDINIDDGLFVTLMKISDMVKYPAESCPLCKKHVKINDELGHGSQFIAEHPEAVKWTKKNPTLTSFNPPPTPASDLLPKKEEFPRYSSIDG